MLEPIAGLSGRQAALGDVELALSIDPSRQRPRKRSLARDLSIDEPPGSEDLLEIAGHIVVVAPVTNEIFGDDPDWMASGDLELDHYVFASLRLACAQALVITSDLERSVARQQQRTAVLHYIQIS
jgi:hypothetical protein